MKLKNLFIILFFTSCKSSALYNIITPVNSDTEVDLLLIQLLAIEIRNEKGKWPLGKDEYAQTFGDSAKTLFLDFNKIDLNHKKDTLFIYYSYKSTIGQKSGGFLHIENADIDYSTKIFSRPINYKIKNDSEYPKVNKEFLPGEGLIALFPSTGKSISIFHKSKDRFKKSKITKAQP